MDKRTNLVQSGLDIVVFQPVDDQLTEGGYFMIYSLMGLHMRLGEFDTQEPDWIWTGGLRCI